MKFVGILQGQRVRPFFLHTRRGQQRATSAWLRFSVRAERKGLDPLRPESLDGLRPCSPRGLGSYTRGLEGLSSCILGVDSSERPVPGCVFQSARRERVLTLYDQSLWMASGHVRPEGWAPTRLERHRDQWGRSNFSGWRSPVFWNLDDSPLIDFVDEGVLPLIRHFNCSIIVRRAGVRLRLESVWLCWSPECPEH